MSPALHVDVSGDGPPLVLLHGWAMHSGVWGPIADKLARRFRVYAVDLPGHGYSGRTTPFTLDGCVEMIDAALRDERAPLAVLGWSLGGQVAMRWARLAPRRIGRLALVCTSPRFVAGADWPHAMTAETLRRFGDELTVAWKLTVQRFLALQLIGMSDGRALLAKLRHDVFARGEPSGQALAEALDVLMTTDLREDAGSIAQPAIVIAGGRDTLTPAAAQRSLAQYLRDARFEPIADAAHVPFLSHQSAFEAALVPFLDAR